MVSAILHCYSASCFFSRITLYLSCFCSKTQKSKTVSYTLRGITPCFIHCSTVRGKVYTYSEHDYLWSWDVAAACWARESDSLDLSTATNGPAPRLSTSLAFMPTAAGAAAAAEDGVDRDNNCSRGGGEAEAVRCSGSSSSATIAEGSGGKKSTSGTSNCNSAGGEAAAVGSSSSSFTPAVEENGVKNSTDTLHRSRSGSALPSSSSSGGSGRKGGYGSEGQVVMFGGITTALLRSNQKDEDLGTCICLADSCLFDVATRTWKIIYTNEWPCDR